MEVSKFRLSRDRYLEDLSVEKIEELLERCGLEEFKEFVRDRDLDGRKLLNITEGIVKLWRPRTNAKKFIIFVEDLKIDPGKYLASQDNRSLETDTAKIDVRMASEQTEESVFQHYKNVGMTKIREINFSTTVSSVEEMLKKIVPAKSFLYRNQKTKTERINSSYVPMEGTSSKKSKTKLHRLSSYEYPFFDLTKFKYFSSETKACSFNDRGYYSMEKANQNTINEKVQKIPIPRSRAKSLTTVDELYSAPDRKIFEDHFYEDLCYSDMNSDSKTRLRSYSTAREFGAMLRSSYTSKIQGIFNSLKLANIFKGAAEKKSKDVFCSFETSSEMYDSIHLTDTNDESSQIGRFEVSKVVVEDYLEPVHWSKDYCDVIGREKEPSLVSAIRRMFEYNFRFRKDVGEPDRPDKSSPETYKSSPTFGADGDETVQKWNANQKRDNPDRKPKMADRPLPVPVEIEPYYQDVDRNEAEKLLAGCEDGAFILRPSSQACHAYTLSVCCGGTVHNIGVRRRPDGQLALGFARRGEKCHPHAAALLEYHQKRHLVLRPVGQAATLGRVILTGPPDHYKVPVHPPKPVASDCIC